MASDKLVRLKIRRRAARKIGSVPDSKLCIMNANLDGVPERDPVFKYLRERGDSLRLSKFYNRSLTEEEYAELEKELKVKRGEMIRELAKRRGIWRETPSKVPEEDVPDVHEEEETTLEPASSKLPTIHRVVEKLSEHGWKPLEISSSLSLCEERSFSKRKLISLVKLGVKPMQVGTFLRAHDELRDAAVASANSPRFFSFKVIKEIFKWAKGDILMVEDFLGFCSERIDEIANMKKVLQRGNRGRLVDMKAVMKKMFHIYHCVHSSFERMEDLPVVEMLAPKPPPDRMHSGKIMDKEIDSEVDLVVLRLTLNSFDIEPLENEEFAADMGNMNEPRRRRRGGL